MTDPASTPAFVSAPLERRAADVARLAATTWDVVIVGGGIVGAGALLDAVSRGLTAALVEQDDIAVGTSSRSSRLIHGGLRYLEQFHIPLVREALAERRRLLRNAPHLVSLEPQLFPVYGIPFLHKAFYDAGLTLYDLLGARHDGGWHRRLDRAETLEIAPPLRREGLRSGEAQTAPPFIPMIIGEGGLDWPAVGAGTTLFLLPILIFTVLLRKHLLRGITFGAVRK